MDLNQILALLRRYAEAIADGRIEARRIETMSDAELAAFDDELQTALEAKQWEAEELAGS
jgi:hypothetical protein